MILVTGGAGFIGSNLVAALAARGERVLVADRLGDGEKWRNLAKHEIEGLLPPEDLLPALDALEIEPQAVFHMGAVSSTTETDGDLIAQTNLTLSQRLWTWCTAHGVPLIYASSAARTRSPPCARSTPTAGRSTPSTAGPCAGPRRGRRRPSGPG
jgi:ADP-L-glycero-D-manno-heptose 6-epimerase